MRSDIRDWALVDGAQEPEQDWDLHLANLREFDLYVELAADDSCPSWDYFLRLLYLIVGDAVRTDFRTESMETIKDILAITERFPKHRFHIFRQRSLGLLDDPTTFDYDDWCAGKLVERDLRHKGTGTLASCTLGELGVLGANPLRGGEENRAKDAKDAKVKGMMDEGTR